MKLVFIVQGEGRGHMTQAIALKEYLKKAGHEVSGVLIGKSATRKIPDFFHEQIEAPVESFLSPNFIMDRKKQAIDFSRTAIYNLKNLREYRRSLKFIDTQMKLWEPDLIVNFYDSLGGIYSWRKNMPAPLICIGHQYFSLHPNFEFPKGQGTSKFLFKTFTKLTGHKATARLALSFKDFSDMPDKNIFVVPPLLRSDVGKLNAEKHDHVLIYILNPGYAEEIKNWQIKHPEVKMKVFWDNAEFGDDYSPQPNLSFHLISGHKFLEALKTCRGFMSTAGFESICEAAYLGKPIFLRPTTKHFEQKCNALDAVRSDIGISGKHFDFDRFMEHIANHDNEQNEFKHWVEQAEAKFIKIIEDSAKPKK
ncbi:MAG: glycosyltransferase family protein [Candidatus Falkowbacteria bacterium]